MISDNLDKIILKQLSAMNFRLGLIEETLKEIGNKMTVTDASKQLVLDDYFPIRSEEESLKMEELLGKEEFLNAMVNKFKF